MLILHETCILLTGEPNSAGDEDCIEVVKANGRWNDNSCNQLRHYICEKSSKLPPHNLSSSHCSYNYNNDYFMTIKISHNISFLTCVSMRIPVL